MNQEHVVLLLDVEQIKLIDIVAKNSGATRSAIVRLAIYDFLSKNKTGADK